MTVYLTFIFLALSLGAAVAIFKITEEEER